MGKGEPQLWSLFGRRSCISAATLALAVFLLRCLSSGWTLSTLSRSAEETGIDGQRRLKLEHDIELLRKQPFSAAERSVLADVSIVIEGRRTVVATALTHQYVDFLENLRCWIEHAGGERLVVFALDSKSFTYARSRGFSTIYMGARRMHRESVHSFGSKEFNLITKQKLVVAHRLLASEYDVLMTDVDVVWCDDCVKRLARVSRNRTKKQGRLETVLFQKDVFRDGKPLVRFNSGFYFARSTDATVRLFGRMIAYGDATAKNSSVGRRVELNDQVVVNHIACKYVGNGRVLTAEEHGGGKTTTVCRWNEEIDVEGLPLAEYPNGGAYFGKTKLFDHAYGKVLEWCKSHKIGAIHSNWMVGSEKRGRLEDHGLWVWNEETKSCATGI